MPANSSQSPQTDIPAQFGKFIAKFPSQPEKRNLPAALKEIKKLLGFLDKCAPADIAKNAEFIEKSIVPGIVAAHEVDTSENVISFALIYIAEWLAIVEQAAMPKSQKYVGQIEVLAAEYLAKFKAPKLAAEAESVSEKFQQIRQHGCLKVFGADRPVELRLRKTQSFWRALLDAVFGQG